MIKFIRQYFRTNKELRLEIEHLQRGLQFYADPTIYDDLAITARLDRGAAARQAIIESTRRKTEMKVL